MASVYRAHNFPLAINQWRDAREKKKCNLFIVIYSLFIFMIIMTVGVGQVFEHDAFCVITYTPANNCPQ